MEKDWRSHRKACEEGWQFSVGPSEDGDVEAAASSFSLRGERVPVAKLIEEVMKVVCTQVVEAAKPGGPLQLEASQEPAWLSMAVGMFTPKYAHSTHAHLETITHTRVHT